jgi:superfamily II DNA or RNA helicase
MEDAIEADSDDDDAEEEDVEWNGEVRTINYHGPAEYTNQLTGANNMTHAGKMAKQFSMDPYRNAMIVSIVRNLYMQNRNVFIFAEHRDYLTRLMQALASSGLVSEAPEIPLDKIHTMMGGITGDEKRDASTHGRIILITYGFGSEQISIPKMDTIIFATSRKSKMKQITGRILRLGGDPTVNRHIIDIVDAKTSIASQVYDRRKVYKARKFTMHAAETHKYNEYNI